MMFMSKTTNPNGKAKVESVTILDVDFKQSKTIKTTWTRGAGEQYTLQYNTVKVGYRIVVTKWTDEDVTQVKAIYGDGRTDNFHTYYDSEELMCSEDSLNRMLEDAAANLIDAMAG